jgi:hypothetical protein
MVPIIKTKSLERGGGAVGWFMASSRVNDKRPAENATMRQGRTQPDDIP